MHKPFFTKAYCRIGIHNFPYKQKESAAGVENAPNYILSQNFLRNFRGPKISTFHFSLPQVLDSKEHFRTILTDSINFRNLLNKGRNKQNTQVVVGGDHFITFASTLSDIDNFGANIGFLHFDSHGDFNLYKQSPSKNFHGMYLRALIDEFDLVDFETLVPNKIPLKNILFIGDLELDKGETSFFKKNKLASISHLDYDKDSAGMLLKVEKFVKRFSHIHISFDVDVFKKELAPATGTPSNNGFEKAPIFEILSIIKKSPSITLDIAEVNPIKEGSEKTIEIAQEVILKLLK